MLKSFTISNYRVFHEPITLDFSKVRDYKFNDNCINNGLISKSIMYGKNAVGKTNLGYALLDVRSMILATDPLGDELGYINAVSEESVAKFSYSFIINNKEIQYNYEKSSATNIKFEELVIDDQVLYRYDFEKGEGDFSNILKYEELKHLNFSEWDDETPVFRYILTNAKLKELLILKEVSSFVEGMAFLRPLEQKFTGPKMINKGLITTIIEDNLVDDFNVFLKIAGINVNIKVDVKPDGEATLYFDYNKKKIEFAKNLSSGTKSLTVIYAILNKLDRITFLYVDELDGNFHFELSEHIIQIFKQKKDCQILITTHNTDLMSNKIMRPDCYFIITPNDIVTVADATTRELREGHNLEKLYQSGEFNEMVSE